MPNTKTTKIKVGNLVKVPDFPEIYTVSEIIDHEGQEPVACFKEKGFWRCSQLEVVNDRTN